MKLKVYVGWDPREDIAWEVCRYSILSRTDPASVEVIPLIQAELRLSGLYKRPADTRAATEFSLTRFLVPTLAGQGGYSIFVDCDFLFLTDIREVLKAVSPEKAVSVVKHDYKPMESNKMDGCVQYLYPRKNWSSFIVFNCAHRSVRSLTPEIVNSADPGFLHQFAWLKDAEIGELHRSWNYLEGWYPEVVNNVKAIHYTRGGPWFESMQSCGFSSLWLEELSAFKEHAIELL